MQVGRNRACRAWLLAGQAEVANERWLRGVAQVIDLRHAARTPVGRTGDDVSDAGVAFPPAFVCVAKPADDNGDTAWLRGIGHVPDFVTGRAVAAQQIYLVLVRARQIAAVAQTHHLCASRFAGAAWLAWNMREVFRLLGFGDVDNRRSVGFLLAGERIERHTAMVPDVGNPPVTLFVDDGLVRAPGLKVVGADQFHVALFSTLLRERISAQNKSQRDDCEKQMPHVTPPFFLSLTLGRHCRSRQGIVQNAS